MTDQERITRLEQMVTDLVEVVGLQGQTIDRLRTELSDEITTNAIRSLPPAMTFTRDFGAR